MIYHNGKRYLRMKNGQPYEEAYSSLTPANIQEIQTYLVNHEGETIIAENGEDWIFKFEPFPENIIQYIKQNKHPMELRYSYRGGHVAYGVMWMQDENDNFAPDEHRKAVKIYQRKSFRNMRLPAVDKWIGNIGYLTIQWSPKHNNEGVYAVAVKVAPKDLRAGEVRLPGIMSLHKTRQHRFFDPAVGKLSLVFKPETIHKHSVEWDIDYETIWETAIMESKTVISQPRNGLGKRDVPFKEFGNSTACRGTRIKKHTITVIRNDLASRGLNGYCWIREKGSSCKGYPDTEAINFPVNSHFVQSSIKFHIRSDYEHRIRVKSESMGWDFHVLKDPIQTATGSGCSEYTSPTIGLTQDVPDLEIIIES